MTNLAFFLIVTLVECLVIAIGFALKFYLRLKMIPNSTLEESLEAVKAKQEKYNHIETTLRNIINVTGQRINKSINNKQENELTRLLKCRVEYLQTELEVLHKNDEDEPYWELLENRLGPLFQEKDKINTFDLDELSNKVEFQSKRIKTLEKFKKLYLDLRKQLKQYQESVEALASALGRGEVNHKDFSQLVLDLRQQDEKLHQQLKQADDVIQKLKQELSKAELEILKFEKRKTAPFELTIEQPQAKPPAGQQITQLKDLVESKFSNLEDLRQTIIQSTGQSKLSPDLDAKLTALENARDELLMCVEVLELENQRLQDQLNTIKDQKNNVDNEKQSQTPEVSTIQDNDNPQSSSDPEVLNKKLVEKNVMIRSLTQTHKEQLQCIAILEDQIMMLESEIKDLKNRESPEKKTPLITSHTESSDLSAQVDSLKQQLQVKTEELAKLRMDYTTLEQEFLSISEDL